MAQLRSERQKTKTYKQLASQYTNTPEQFIKKSKSPYRKTSIYSSERPNAQSYDGFEVNNQIFDQSIQSASDEYERPSVHSNLEILKKKQMLIMKKCKKMRYETPMLASTESIGSIEIVDQQLTEVK